MFYYGVRVAELNVLLDDAGISRIVNRCEKEYRLPEGSEDCSSSPLIRGHGQDTQHTDTSQTTRVQEETLKPSSCALAKHSPQNTLPVVQPES